jgi:glycine cleavage system H protein
MPVSGEVIEINDALVRQPELVNSDPYGDGWMIRVRIEEAFEDADLMTASEYAKMVGQPN